MKISHSPLTFPFLLYIATAFPTQPDPYRTTIGSLKDVLVPVSNLPNSASESNYLVDEMIRTAKHRRSSGSGSSELSLPIGIQVDKKFIDRLRCALSGKASRSDPRIVELGSDSRR